jgi:hypothetical protein
VKLTTTQLRQIIKEEIATMASSKDPERFLHGHESGHPNDDEGYMMKLRLASLKKMVMEICELVEMGDQFPGWVQDHVAVAHENMHQIHGYLTGDEMIRQHGVKQLSVAEGLKRIDEAHTRITSEEIAAWRSGDWGFISEADKDTIKDPNDQPGSWSADYEVCKSCGFDHRYEPAEALAAHKKKSKK